MSSIAKVAQQTPYAHRVAEPEASHTLRGHRKIRVGRVMSNRMQKSIVVRVAHLTRHAAPVRQPPESACITNTSAPSGTGSVSPARSRIGVPFTKTIMCFLSPP